MPKGIYKRRKRRKEPRFCEPPSTSKRVTIKFPGEPVRLGSPGIVEFCSTNKNPVEILDEADGVVKRLGTDPSRYSADDFYFSAPRGYAVRGAAGDKAVFTYQLAAIEENS